MMWERGYFDTTQMAGAFQLLRSNDLIWSRLTRDYLMGERAPPSDLMAWNADATRLPYRMHSEYLRKLFLNNDLAGGDIWSRGRADLAVRTFTPRCSWSARCRDHVAPWKSVFKIHHQADADVTFLLASGGHQCGNRGASWRTRAYLSVKTKAAHAHLYRSGRMAEHGAVGRGSWWPEWGREVAGRTIRRAHPGRPGSGTEAARGEEPGLRRFGDYVRH